MTILDDGWNQTILLIFEFQHVQPPCVKMKKPAEGFCQRAALPIAPGDFKRSPTDTSPQSGSDDDGGGVPARVT
jgi:hypothetical protein